jgi:tRNA (guanine10-N2)-dimethyltransferase
MQTYDYIAILGRQPELGLIELESILGRGEVVAFGAHAFVSSLPPIDRLGGTIKQGRIIARLPRQRLDKLQIDTTLLPRPEGKLTFAVSAYGLKLVPRELEAFGLSLKKVLKASGSVRLVLPKPGSDELTAAQLKFNGLPEAGFELLLVGDGQEIIVALTEAVQDIDAYTARDYERPARSATVGMLPPKLAQILINTVHGPTIYDPFCGTGVILQEALLMGREANGSDLEDEMVEATRTNLNWLAGRTADLSPWGVMQADATKVQLPDKPLAIVSEGYLGPNLTGEAHRDDLRGLIEPLLELYRDSLANLARQLPSGAEVSICAPAWRQKDSWKVLPIVDEITNLGYTIKDFEVVSRSPIVYGRAGQAVGRALILLTKV